MNDLTNEFVWVVLNPHDGIQIINVYTSAEGAHAAARKQQELFDPEDGNEIRVICSRLIDTVPAINDLHDHLEQMRHLKETRDSYEEQQQQQILDEEKAQDIDGTPSSYEERDEDTQ